LAAPLATNIPQEILQPGNVSQVVEVNRMVKLSVLEMAWIKDKNGLVDGGTNSVSFIDAKSTQASKVSLDGGIPTSMSISNNRLYVLVSGSIKVIDIATRKLIKDISPLAGGTMSIAASPDGKLLALGISNNKTQLISTEDGSVVRNLKSNYGGWSVAFSPDSKYVISGTSRGLLKWETSTGIWQPIIGGQENIIKNLAISHDGKIIAGGGDGFIYFWDLETGALLEQVDHEKFGIVNSLDFSPDDSLLVTGTDDAIVRIWDVSSASLLRELSGHSGPVVGVCFSPDGQNIASGAKIEASIRIWGLP
jgi:WD40 repeat protein